MKFQELLVTDGSKVAGILGSIVKAIESDALELNVEEVSLCFNGVCRLDIELLTSSGGIDVEVSGAPWLSEMELSLEDLMVEISLKPSSSPRRGVKLSAIYESLPELILKLDSSMLRALSKRTTLDGVEYMALYMDRGSVAVLEGDVHKVTIPSIEALGIVHTHPEGACGFSEVDVRSTAYALSNLTLFEAVTTPSCAFYIARIGFLDEKDFETLLNNTGGITTPARLPSIKIGRLTYSTW